MLSSSDIGKTGKCKSTLCVTLFLLQQNHGVKHRVMLDKGFASLYILHMDKLNIHLRTFFGTLHQ